MLAASHLVLSVCNKLSPKIRGGAISERVHHAIFVGQQSSASNKPRSLFYENQVGCGQKHSGSSPCKICSTTSRDGNIALRQKWMDTFSGISRRVLYNKQLFLKAPKSRQLCVTIQRFPCRNKDAILCIYPGREGDAILVPLLFIFRFVHTYIHSISKLLPILWDYP